MTNSRRAQVAAARLISSRSCSSCTGFGSLASFCAFQHTDERAGLAKTIGFGRYALEEGGNLFRREHPQQLGPFLPGGFGLTPSLGPILQVPLRPVNNLRPHADQGRQPPVALAILLVKPGMRVGHIHAFTVSGFESR